MKGVEIVQGNARISLGPSWYMYSLVLVFLNSCSVAITFGSVDKLPCHKGDHMTKFRVNYAFLEAIVVIGRERGREGEGEGEGGREGGEGEREREREREGGGGREGEGNGNTFLYTQTSKLANYCRCILE